VAAGRVDWSPKALRDLIDIYRAIAVENPQAALEQAEHIIKRAEALSGQPRLGKASHWRGRRMLVLTRYPYSIYYRTSRRAVQVVRVVHQRRRFP
jgi:plasmid stabilization system protein ParE